MSTTGPSHLGRYAVRRRIGSGGFATVWLAYDEQLDAPVAIKVLADNWSEQHEVRTRFIEEGRFLRRVESPHVVPVYDAGALDDGRPYLVMAYADQGTLADRLAASGLTIPQAYEVITQVGAGLQALHDRGVLHRDVKPANVLFRSAEATGDGTQMRAMLGDLGLGKALDVSSRLTVIAGTPAFVAPEQAQGEAPDPRADQFSLGVLTFLLLSGRLPWDHATLPAAAAPKAPKPLSTGQLVFPPAVEQVVGRAIARDREDRWPSVAAYVEALGEALRGWVGDADQSQTRVLPVDPQLTIPGQRPTQPPASGARTPTPVPSSGPSTGPSSGSYDWLHEPAPSSAGAPPADPPTAPMSGGQSGAPPRRRGRGVLAAALVAVVGLALGGAGGYFAQQTTTDDAAPTTSTVEDETERLAATVPAEWTAYSVGPWQPPNGMGKEYAALSVGTSPTWNQDGEGLFLGLLPGTELPEELPGHSECTADDPSTDANADDPRVTAFYTKCGPGRSVIVEQVVQVSDGQLLWVQLHTADRAAAKAVLDAIRIDV
ncbi:serine/threonine-protein kinase [Nocardioides sp. GXZ039]|uniref:serine/threonine-protein kinase n=1 Tax=Nocardioides sp. GXZ039 TaxID=3136018 RepID=UPI0030F45E9F